MSGYVQDVCCTPKCTNLQVVMNYNYNGTGMPGYRKWCRQCHDKRTGALHGLNSVKEVVAMNAGFDNVTDYQNSIHRYRKYRKDYCENIDGRLGYTCDSTIRISAQLQVDHIDGDPSNDEPENLQTLCALCHICKTHMYKDYATAGRKTLKVNLVTVKTNPVKTKTKTKTKLVKFKPSKKTMFKLMFG